MYLLRRAAARSLSSQSTAVLIKPRTLATKTPSTLRAQKWQVSSFQRRFASEDASPAQAKTSGETVTTEPSKVEQEMKAEVESAQEKGEEVKEQIKSEAEPVAERAEQVKEKSEEVVEQAKSTVAETVQNVAETAKETASSTVAAAQDAASQLLGDSARTADVGTFGKPKASKILYVGNLFFEVEAEELQREFSRFGEVVNCRIAQDPKGLSKGFGYVEFQDSEQAAKAVEAMDQQILQGRRMAVQYHVRRDARPNRLSNERGPRVENPPSRVLFIGNMSFQMSDKDLNDAFRDIKNVLDVRVAIDRRSGQPRGFAHADFIDVKSAEEAKKVLEKKVIFGRRLRVDFSRDSRDRRGSAPPSE